MFFDLLQQFDKRKSSIKAPRGLLMSRNVEKGRGLLVDLR